MSVNWDEQPLGERSDAALGRELGVSPDTVRWARRRRGIELTAAARAEGNARRRAGGRKGFDAGWGSDGEQP